MGFLNGDLGLILKDYIDLNKGVKFLNYCLFFFKLKDGFLKRSWRCWVFFNIVLMKGF